MKLKNRFNDKTRELFMYHYGCGECGRSDRGIELHHILSTVSNSPFNCIPLCPQCHEELGRLEPLKKKWLHYTAEYLIDQKGYEPNENDVEFYKKFTDYYNARS